MKYIKVNVTANYCGYDENWLVSMTDEDYEEIGYDENAVIEDYSYNSELFGSFIESEDEDEYEEFNVEVGIELISEEEFLKLRDEDNWEVR